MANSIPEVSKRRRMSQNDNHNHNQLQQQPLLPGLPDHIAQACLSLVDPTTLYSVCRSWRRVIYTRSFPPFLSLYALFSCSSSNSIQFYNFDPVSSKWGALPSTPPDPPLRLFLRHPAFISRNLPIQSVSASGNLVLLAATTHNFFPALPRPLNFDPSTSSWHFGPPLATPRRWCAAGTLRDAVYVASGIGSHFSVNVARSVEKWDLSKKNNSTSPNGSEYLGGEWERVSSLRDGRFSRDAIDAVGWRGKLCMVNVKGDALKDGVVYDAEKDTWQDMPEGMIAGWTGPVAAMDEDVMYVVDEAKGALRRYDPGRDTWHQILESESLKGADQIAAGGGRVCAVCRGRIVVVDVAAPRPRVWDVETPSGLEAVAIHILPRMCQLV
ncbi:putative F-box domain, kelch-type beta propeller [Rosa chinensis]|uniref:Putative F-box domain, kelch-type beta propeller n=1 Tax=Rosa chinensis TaxID=74649 RepID=A0A2P6PB53_ROSCH|nr:F-box/kelch-repeat protein SKIP25 [Rosa chinensis]XP_040368033.1 F-box/kelch-repeat protein SKIP25 [Rosa chinensis]PRQ19148.1 putative F-box domain, kelch-type beta propeller [Rosa chinensis]